MLPKEAYELQKMCKSWAKTNDFNSEGSILIKKANGDKTFVIRNQQDLQNIPTTQQAVNPPVPPTLPLTQSSQSTTINPIIQPSILNPSRNK